MEPIKIGIAQFTVARGDPESNLIAIARYAADAAASGAALLLLPEMCTTGFDWHGNRKLLRRSGAVLGEISAIARRNRIAISGSFLAVGSGDGIANTLVYFDKKGQQMGAYRKIHLFSIFNEDAHVEAGNEVVLVDTPMGKMGASICYDLRFPELFRACNDAGAKIQFLPAAFPHPRLSHWQTLVRARAIENQCYFIAVNQCGTEGSDHPASEICYFGHSTVVDPWGGTVVEADESEGLWFADIDPSMVDAVRKQLPALQDRRPELFNHGRDS